MATAASPTAGSRRPMLPDPRPLLGPPVASEAAAVPVPESDDDEVADDALAARAAAVVFDADAQAVPPQLLPAATCPWPCLGRVVPADPGLGPAFLRQGLPREEHGG